MSTYYIFKCPECGGLQVDTEPESVLQACIHSQGRGRQPRVVERERIQVIPRAIADELAAVVEADPTNYPSSRSLGEARDAALANYQEAISYGKTASGKPITDELVEELAAKAETGFEHSFFIESQDAQKVREGLRERGVPFTESKWQPGIRLFEIAKTDVPKLEGLIG